MNNICNNINNIGNNVKNIYLRGIDTSNMFHKASKIMILSNYLFNL